MGRLVFLGFVVINTSHELTKPNAARVCAVLVFHNLQKATFASMDFHMDI